MFRSSLSRLAGLTFSAVFFLAVIVFCFFYIFSSYDYLCHWYLGLGGHINRMESWTADFFTPVTRAAGNRYCIAAIAIAGLGLVYVYNCLRAKEQMQGLGIHFRLDMRGALSLAGCIFAGSLMWVQGNLSVKPSNDEVFSAVACAGMHPFQTLSYYMAPNNHILFNLLNNLVFHAAADKGGYRQNNFIDLLLGAHCCGFLLGKVAGTAVVAGRLYRCCHCHATPPYTDSVSRVGDMS